MDKNQRNSNLEVLRIISMIFIIAFHLVFHGFEGVNLISSNPNNYIIYFLSVFGKIGVDVFILISAYFMINSKFKVRKFLILGGEVYFYSILFLVLFLTVLTPISPIQPLDLLRTFLPISHSLYWFITDYIVLMLLSPFLNQIIKKISRNDLIKLMIITLIIWSLYPTFTGVSFGFNQMIWFVILYLIGSFIKLYLNISKINSKHLILLFIGSIVLSWLFICASLSISFLKSFYMFQFHHSVFNRENSIFILTASLSLFLIFLKKKEFSNKYINYIAGSVLGVYLIHENVFASPFIWKMLQVPSHYYSPYFILFVIIAILLIYFVCTGIDIIRRITVEKLWIWIIDNKLNNIPNTIYNKLNLINDKFRKYLN